MKPTLIVLAAGMASRFGSMKQTAGFGPNNETIMDYSIFDAIKAGFGKVVFIIRKDFSASFEKIMAEKLEGKVLYEFVYQELNSFVDPVLIPTDRVKPWGTGHAILCAHEKVHEPFAVINADDFYGYDAFEKAASFLHQQCNEQTQAIIGYQLGNTLSEYGSVSRGVCEVDLNDNLISIVERTKIYKNGSKIVFEEKEGVFDLKETSIVSMNFWCFHQSVFDSYRSLFKEFINNRHKELTSEFFIPIVAEAFIRTNGNAIKVIPTHANWFGVTYKEDAEGVKNNISKLIANHIYPANLWGA